MAGTLSVDLSDRVRTRLVDAGAVPTPASVAVALRAEGYVLGDAALLEAAEELYRELAGAGPLEPYLREAGVTDVLVNAPDDVWIERRGRLERVDVRFPDEAAVRRLAQRLAVLGGRRLDDASPWVDALLPGGARLHAVVPPVSTRGTTISLRLPRAVGYELGDLAATGMLHAVTAQLLHDLVTARVAFLVSGGTGSGKTTLLQALLALVPDGERLVIVEDCAELRPRHPHVVALEARPANQEGVGAVGLRDLVRQALRMRPDRLVVGEVRGHEVVDLLNALNTGHEGGCGTVHANRAEDVPARLEALALPAGLSREAVHSQMAAGIDCVIHVKRTPEGHRRLDGVSVLCREASGLVRLVPAVVTDDSDDTATPRAALGYRRLRELVDHPLPPLEGGAS